MYYIFQYVKLALLLQQNVYWSLRSDWDDLSTTINYMVAGCLTLILYQFRFRVVAEAGGIIHLITSFALEGGFFFHI